MTIPRDGLSTGKTKVSVETDGVQGAGCTDLTAGLEAALGMTAADQELKAEYYQVPAQQVQLNQGKS